MLAQSEAHYIMGEVMAAETQEAGHIGSAVRNRRTRNASTQLPSSSRAPDHRTEMPTLRVYLSSLHKPFWKLSQTYPEVCFHGFEVQ